MKRIIFIFSLWPLLLLGQGGNTGFTFSELPKDLQLFARNSSNVATVVIDGAYNRQVGAFDYDKIRLKINGTEFGATLDLIYVNDEDDFNWTVPIEAGLTNYDFLIQARFGGDWYNIVSIDDVVAGDVYIIQGQSNAEANEFDGSVETDPQKDQFIRVYASGTSDDSDLRSNDNWYLGQGNGRSNTDGNTGQWGFKLSQQIIANQGVPVAIFNGSKGGKSIWYFIEGADGMDLDGEPTNNYERLLYRLEKTNLQNDVKAILWSQGENTKAINSVNIYKGYFEDLLSSWNNDYKSNGGLSSTGFYLFQTLNGCNSNVEKLMYTKEAQRQLASEPTNSLKIMATDGLAQVDVGDDNGFCHFSYLDGYESFATRIYELVEKDIYDNDNNGSGIIDITAPDIIDAYLTSPTTLVVETNANSLTKGNYLDIFNLEGTTATIIQDNIQVFGNKILFELSSDPGNDAYITNSGAEPGVINNFITNSRGIEIVSFLRFPISRDIFVVDDDLMFTQYYHDSSNTNKWLEVKNISNATVPANIFFLNLFENNTNSPTEIEPIPEMESGEVILFYKNGFLPTAPNIGNVDKIDSKVCSFDGSQVIAISTSFGNNAYADRIDVLGDSPGNLWGRDKSFVKSDNNSSPDIDFQISNWVNIENRFVNDVQSTDSNVTLGAHNIGSTSWDGLDWTNHAAGPARTVNLSNDYNANNGSLHANDLTITANLNFNNGTKNSVVVHGDLVVSGAGQFTIGDQESLVMYKSNALITGEVTKLENSSERNNIRDFTYWSSPVVSSDAVIGSVFTGVEPNRIFYYDQSRSTATDPSQPTYWDVWQVAPGNMTMTAGVGFASEGIDDDVHRISFTGKPNNGDVSVPIVYQDPGNDFNLIGNPYPSAININDFFAENQNVDAAYLWTHNTQISGGLTGDFNADDYATINNLGGASAAPSGGSKPEENIGSSQGFFVNAVTSGGSITFKNSMRLEEANDQFFKSTKTKKKTELVKKEEKDRIWLDLKTDQGGFSQILLGFKRGLTNKVDNGYDAPRFPGSGNPVSFYSLIGNEKYVIQGKRTFISLRKFKLGFDTRVAPRTFTISVSEKEGVLKEANIYLVDKLLNVTHDLNTSSYSFFQETKGEFMDRFILKFEDTSIPENESEEDSNDFVIINGFNDYIAIKANNKVVQVSVHDIYGNELFSKTPNAYKFVINSRNFDLGAVLIVSVKFENGEVLNKKTIKF